MKHLFSCIQLDLNDIFIYFNESLRIVFGPLLCVSENNSYIFISKGRIYNWLNGLIFSQNRINFLLDTSFRLAILKGFLRYTGKCLSS